MTAGAKDQGPGAEEATYGWNNLQSGRSDTELWLSLGLRLRLRLRIRPGVSLGARVRMSVGSDMSVRARVEIRERGHPFFQSQMLSGSVPQTALHWGTSEEGARGSSGCRTRLGVSCWQSREVTHEQELTRSRTWGSEGEIHLLLTPPEILCRAAVLTTFR